MQSIPPTHTPRYAVQFNAARVDSLPVEAHDRGWAVYPSDLYLPVNFSFGAERCWTCASQGVFCEVEGRVARPRIWFHHVGFVQVRLFNGIVFVWKGIHSKLFGQVLVTERDHQHDK